MAIARTLAVLILALLVLAPAHAEEERTLEAFQAYLEEKLPHLGDDRIAAIAKRVDADGNGIISEEEFGKRMAVVRAVMQEPTAPAETEPEPRTPSREIPPIDDHAADVLLITSEALRASWQPFATWKTALGKRTKIVTLAQIRAAFADKPSHSIQERIRRCVREHIDKRGTRWVVLGGDCLPGGRGEVPGGHTTVHRREAQGIPTDIVYLSPTNWDADGDGILGEWNDDRDAITYPDGRVGLGRIPVRTAEDVAAFTDKVIAYESRYPTTAFATQMIYTCTDSPAYPKVRKSWDAHVSKAWPAGSVGRFFSQETPWDEEGQPGSYPLSPANLVKLINARSTGKLHIHGHGLLPQWILENNGLFTARQVGQLENEGHYPLITTVSCNTGEYDNAKDPSIVESMLRRPGGGSVAIVAPVRTGKPHFHDPRRDFPLMVKEGKLDGTTMTMTRYWENGLGSRAATTGEALMLAKASMIEDANETPGYHLCLCEINLLGAPTLDMRAAPPRTPKLEHVQQIAPGKQSLTLRTDAPGATLCLWKGDEIYARAVADASGSATFEIEPRTPGPLRVTVSGSSLNVASGTIQVR